MVSTNENLTVSYLLLNVRTTYRFPPYRIFSWPKNLSLHQTLTPAVLESDFHVQVILSAKFRCCRLTPEKLSVLLYGFFAHVFFGESDVCLRASDSPLVPEPKRPHKQCCSFKLTRMRENAQK